MIDSDRKDGRILWYVDEHTLYSLSMFVDLDQPSIAGGPTWREISERLIPSWWLAL